MRFAGSIDIADDKHVAGWIFDHENPQSPIELELMMGDSVLASCTADKLREDLRSAGLGSGHCGFEFAVPFFTPGSENKSLGVRVRGTPLFLKQAPPPIVSRTKSRFGGLWIDRDDWIDELALRHRTGRISDDVADRIFRFVRDGYLVIPKAVSDELTDAFAADIERLWDQPPEKLLVYTFEPDNTLKMVTANKKYQYGHTKLCDVYAFSEAARNAIAAPLVTEFLSAIFDDAPKAFQGLYFHQGSEQSIHKDTAYVKIDNSPMSLAATWLALEDVEPGTGELTYYIGSHRAPEFLFGGVHKWMEGHEADHVPFLESLHVDATKFNQVQGRFLPKKGDVLIWHADLAHGGAKIERPRATRRSQVTHFTAASNEPFYRRVAQHQYLQRPDCHFVSNFSSVPG